MKTHGCENCSILKKKLEIYENFIKDIRSINNLEQQSLSDSIIIERSEDGEEKKVKSNLTESFTVIDKLKKIEELDKSLQDLVGEQDNLIKIENAKKYLNKANLMYSVGYYLSGIGKWLLFI